MQHTDRHRRDRPASLSPPLPANGGRNRHRADGRGEYRADGHNGGHIAGGRNAADGRSGRFPLDGHNDGHPADRRNRRNPAGGRGGELPTDSHIGRHLANDHNGGRPVNDRNGGYPAADGGAGGFFISRDPVPPAGADRKLWADFLVADKDRSGRISVHGLQGILLNEDSTPFDPETVKLLISLFDTNQTGEIDFDEFTRLSQYIKEWQRMFQHFDQDHSGTIDGLELQSALNQYGMKLPPQLIYLLVAKFASSPGSQMGEQTITFDRFIRAWVFIKKFKKSFANLHRDKDGRVQLSYEQCLKLYLMLP